MPTLWSSSTLAAPVFHICRGGELELSALPETEYQSPMSRTGGNAPTAILSDRPQETLASGIWVGFSSAPFPHPSFLLALPTVLFRPRGVYTDVVLNHPIPLVSPPPVRPSLLPTLPECRVRDVPRLPTLPAARAGALQLNDAERMRSVTTNFEATLCVLDAPHPTPKTCYHAHGLGTPAHPRYDTQQALTFLHTHAAIVDPMDASTILSPGTCDTNVASLPLRLLPIPYAAFLIYSYLEFQHPNHSSVNLKRIARENIRRIGIPRFFFLLDSSPIQSMDLLTGPYLATIRLGRGMLAWI
ncbi:hypothetical protein K438DRAFT_2031889 [Mycena galopus ATCC 62051]|nr:hypothetical protein K438DRAFT_2031889 [Mycena galopus ATCC 62051]